VTQDLKDLIRYRSQRARETLEDARVLAQPARWNSCVNRLYYACFYAVTALLLKKDLSSSKHSGIRALFSQHYVRTGIVSKKLARIFNDLFERRQESDYIDFKKFNKDHVLLWQDQAGEFVESILRLLSEDQL